VASPLHSLDSDCHSDGTIARRDGGDCNINFYSAGNDSLSVCNRATCQSYFQDYNSFFPQTCQSKCFTASCDWSRTMCSNERASIATCPLFDVVALRAIRQVQSSRALTFVNGGTARYQLGEDFARNRNSYRAHFLFC
jgi:hypothetical protein